MSWFEAILLLIQGGVCGLVIAELVRFTKRDGKLYPMMDERPVSRTLLAAVALVGLMITLRLVSVDVDTRVCIEETREAISDIYSGQLPTPPLSLTCK